MGEGILWPLFPVCRASRDLRLAMKMLLDSIDHLFDSARLLVCPY